MMSRLSDDDLLATREDVLALKADIHKMYRDMKYDTLLIVGSVSLIQTLIYYAIIILATAKH
jgi:uncharacterized membrane protein